MAFVSHKGIEPFTRTVAKAVGGEPSHETLEKG